jgi:hypothetical protein
MVKSKMVKRKDLLASDFIPHSNYDRAVRAEKEFRDPGISHHPCRLTHEEDNTILQIVMAEARSGPAPSAKKVADLV